MGKLCYNIMTANSQTLTLAYNISVPINIWSIKQPWQLPVLSETYLNIIKLSCNLFLDLKVLLGYLIKSLGSSFRIFFTSVRKRKLHQKHTRDYVFARLQELRPTEKYLRMLRLVITFWKSQRWVPGIISFILLSFIATSVLCSWNAQCSKCLPLQNVYLSIYKLCIKPGSGNSCSAQNSLNVK